MSPRLDAAALFGERTPPIADANIAWVSNPA